MSGSEPSRDVALPESVVERVEARLPRTEWDDPAEYITHVLEEVLYHVEAETDEDVEAVDEEAVEDRLRDLGYLNE